MLSLQEAIGLDMDAMTSGFGFTPWEADTCPTLDELMAASSTSSPSSSGAAVDQAAGLVEDEEEHRRRQRRKVSNRLSAQRSRARKQQRLEELRGTVARFRVEKRELAAKLHAVARHELAVRRQNARLRTEEAALKRRLHRLLALQRLMQQLRSRRPPPGAGSGPGGAAFPPAAALGLASLMTY